jgi:hydroxymethylpyrimidine pyrophosphatase-like HAD family hydrolase
MGALQAMTRHIAVDLDGTLASQDETGGPTDIGAPVQGILAAVNEALAAGDEVSIFTTRMELEQRSSRGASNTSGACSP